jgi:hypothetical protein
MTFTFLEFQFTPPFPQIRLEKRQNQSYLRYKSRMSPNVGGQYSLPLAYPHFMLFSVGQLFPAANQVVSSMMISETSIVATVGIMTETKNA